MSDGNLFALLIGINQYDSTNVRSLGYAVADVTAFSDVLSSRFGLAPDRCEILCHPATGKARVPKRSEFLRTLDRFSNAPMDRHDTFVLYYAGHGFETDDTSYLLATDSEPGSPMLLKETAVSLQVLTSWFKTLRAGQQILILDACRNDPIANARDLGARPMFGKVMARDIEIMAATQSTIGEAARNFFAARTIVNSCAQGQVSYEYAEGGHGWFCHNLLQVIKSRPEGNLLFNDLLEETSERMRERAWRELPEAKEQRPYVEIEGSPVILQLGPRRSADPPSPKSDPPPPAPPATPATPEPSVAEPIPQPAPSMWTPRPLESVDTESTGFDDDRKDPGGLEDMVEFAQNPEPRCPCLLVLDTSASMFGQRLDALNEGLWAFRDDLLQDPLACRRVEVGIVTFGKEVRLHQPFVTTDKFKPPLLEAAGMTPMGRAVDYALDLIEERKSKYRNVGISYYRPWMFLITDGSPTDRWEKPARRVKKAESKKALSFFSVGVERANLAILREFSSRPPLRLDGIRFVDMFIWLSRSTQTVSRSRLGERVDLPAANWVSR